MESVSEEMSISDSMRGPGLLRLGSTCPEPTNRVRDKRIESGRSIREIAHERGLP